MRFLLREMEYEKPLASGHLHFVQDGASTGLEEQWRFTRALDGYFFLRIDVDANVPARQDTTLVHMLLNPKLEIERLKFRHFGSQEDVEGDLQFDADTVSYSRALHDKNTGRKGRKAVMMTMKPDSLFWFPSILGYTLAAKKISSNKLVSYASLDVDNHFEVVEGQAQFSWSEEALMPVIGRTVVARPCLIRWNDTSVKVWLDKDGWPVSASLSGGTSAADRAIVRYR